MARQYADVTTREDVATDAKHMREVLANPETTRLLENPRNYQKRCEKLEEQVEKLTPKPFATSDERAEAQARLNLLTTAFNNGRQNIPRRCTTHEMELNPAGALPRHLAHEKFWASRNLDANGDPFPSESYSITEEMQDLKLRIAYADGNDEPGAGNIEETRPQGRRPALADANPFVDPPVFAMSPRGAANLEAAGFYAEPTRSEAVKLREYEEKMKAQAEEINRLKQRLNPNPGPSACIMTKKNGEPCSGKPLRDTGLCVSHTRLAQNSEE